MTLARLDSTLDAMLHRPKLTSTNGALLRNPRGGVEDVEEMRDALGPNCWLALNVGDGQHWSDWQVVIDRARAANVEVLPWARCRTLVECHELLETADMFASKCLLNIEDEFKDVLPPSRVAALLPDYTLQSKALDVGISTVGWLYGTDGGGQADVDYSSLTNYPFLLQVFWEDMKFDPALMEQKQADCVRHARLDKEITYVGVTFMTVRSNPSYYAYWGGPRSWYTGDNIPAGTWSEWAV